MSGWPWAWSLAWAWTWAWARTWAWAWTSASWQVVFCRFSGHRQARKVRKLEQPRLALVSLLHWYGAKGVKRERATLQKGWPVSRRSIKHTRAMICKHRPRPAPPRRLWITGERANGRPSDLPGLARSAASRPPTRAFVKSCAVPITLPPGCALIRGGVDDVDVRPGFLCGSCKIESWRGREHSHAHCPSLFLALCLSCLERHRWRKTKLRVVSEGRNRPGAVCGAHLIQSASSRIMS